MVEATTVSLFLPDLDVVPVLIFTAFGFIVGFMFGLIFAEKDSILYEEEEEEEKHKDDEEEEPEEEEEQKIK